VKSYDRRTQLLKEGDEVLAVINANTKETIAFFSNFGKVYCSRIYDLDVSGKGYGDPIQTVFNFQDEEKIVTALTSESESGAVFDISFMIQTEEAVDEAEHGQLTFFPDMGKDTESREPQEHQPPPPLCLVLTRQGTGFCFERSTLKEPSARGGRTLIRLRSGDEVVAVRPVQRALLAIATNRRVLLTPMAQVNVLAGTGRGIKLIKPDPPGVLDFFTVSKDDYLLIQSKKGKEKELAVAEQPIYNRGAKGAVIRGGIAQFSVKAREEEVEDPESESGESYG
jgi:DNA gyrase/topoisomerase IV subunit A